jgi:hypothetical protein
MIQHVAGWYYDFRVRNPGLLVARMALLHTVRRALGSASIWALLEEVTKLNTLVPDVWLIPCQPIVGGGQRRAARRAL